MPESYSYIWYEHISIVGRGNKVLFFFLQSNEKYMVWSLSVQLMLWKALDKLQVWGNAALCNELLFSVIIIRFEIRAMPLFFSLQYKHTGRRKFGKVPSFHSKIVASGSTNRLFGQWVENSGLPDKKIHLVMFDEDGKQFWT